MASTRTLVNRLLALRSASLAVTSLISKFDAISRAKSSDPTGNHGTSLASLTIALDKLRVTLDGSTIQGDHPLRQEATKFENHLCRLTTKEKKSDSPPTFTTTPAPTTGHKTHHLPKMTLPTFHGDLMAWTSKHCRTLTKTIPVKNTFTELNTLADELRNASTGMKDLGQFDIESLVTSLNVVRLTKSLHEQWELQTDSSSKVLHMNEFSLISSAREQMGLHWLLLWKRSRENTPSP